MSLLSAPLKAFRAIAEQGTVHGAAQELGLTQTGVTQRIRALEKELGTTLFLRSRKGMRLTQEGEALLRYCRGAEDLEGQVFSQLSGGAKDRPIYVTLAGPTSVMTARITDQCSPLYFQWPQLQLNLVISDQVDRLSRIRSGQFTLAVVAPEQVPNEMDSKKLKPDKYVLVASAKWKGRRLQDLLQSERVIDFQEDDPTTLNYLKKFGIENELLRPRLFVNNNEALIKYFVEGIGFGTLTKEIAKPHIDAGHLIALNGGAVMEQGHALVWYPRSQMPAYLKAIIRAIH